MRKELLLLVSLVMFCFSSLMAQQSVTGKVLDDKGVPVIGASVVQKNNRKNGTSTDASGSFTLSVPNGGTVLVISSVGFAATEVAASNASKVTLAASSETISEVVVTSLGIKREKKALGYAVASVDKKQLELRPEGDPMRLLQGKAPGVNILNSSGISGSGTNITIRGVSTISGNSQPLFVVKRVAVSLISILTILRV